MTDESTTHNESDSGRENREAAKNQISTHDALNDPGTSTDSSQQQSQQSNQQGQQGQDGEAGD
jgi:hypothetical protein